MSFPLAATRPAASPALILAPMATLSHAALRTLIEQFGGCDLYFSEMVSAEAHIGGTPFERYYSETAPAPQRLVFQLIGRGQDALVEAARRLGDTPCAGIDLNFGCSAPQIRKSGAGIAWTRDHARAAQLAAAVRRAVPSNKSVSVKLRLADDGEPQHSLDLARRLTDAGIDFITLHPRRMSDSYSRPARRAVIEQFSRGLNIPVVASGDVQTQADVAACCRLGAAACMIGRAAAARPWIFAQLQGTAPQRIDLAQLAAQYYRLLQQWQPKEFLSSRLRRFHHYFLASIPFGRRLAAQVQGMRDAGAIAAHVADYFERYPHFRFVTPDSGGSDDSQAADRHAPLSPA